MLKYLGLEMSMLISLKLYKYDFHLHMWPKV